MIRRTSRWWEQGRILGRRRMLRTSVGPPAEVLGAPPETGLLSILLVWGYGGPVDEFVCSNQPPPLDSDDADPMVLLQRARSRRWPEAYRGVGLSRLASISLKVA